MPKVRISVEEFPAIQSGAVSVIQTESGVFLTPQFGYVREDGEQNYVTEDRLSVYIVE